MTDSQAGASGNPTTNIVLVAVVSLTLGAPLLWSFAFAGLGALTWLMAAFGWLPGDWFVTNLALLGTASAVIAAPIMAWTLYRFLPRVAVVERDLTRQRSFVPNAGVQKTPASPSR